MVVHPAGGKGTDVWGIHHSTTQKSFYAFATYHDYFAVDLTLIFVLLSLV